DRNKFLQLLQKMVNSHKIHLFSYVLMDTHFHLLLKTEEANLSQAMQFLNSSYAHWYNIRHIRKGHLFQDRYKSYLILNSLYLYSVASYISLNPVEAELVDSPEKYPWSSFQYLLSAPNKDVPLWLNIREFLKLCQTNPENFINFVKENIQKDDPEKILQNVTKITSNQTQNKSPGNIENILRKTKEQIGDIETNKRLKHLLIYLLIKENYRIKDITNSLRITRQGALKIYKKMQKNLITDHIYQLWLNHIKINLFS
ncbi:MAG: transposase, partial [Candidatus Atribacteria bacterium]|nr:transposase [Candidatus Atribacteria bacterium]